MQTFAQYLQESNNVEQLDETVQYNARLKAARTNVNSLLGSFNPTGQLATAVKAALGDGYADDFKKMSELMKEIDETLENIEQESSRK